MTRQLSPAGLDFLQQREGFSATPYRDSGGIWTIGYGTIYHDGMPNPMTPEQALSYVWAAIHRCEDTVNDCVTAPISQSQFDALVSFAYNEGCHALATSTLLRRINVSAPWDEIKHEFLRWDFVGKVATPGLENRRAAEYALFRGAPDGTLA